MLECSPPHRPLPQHSGALQTSPPGLAPLKGSGASTSRLAVAWARDRAWQPRPLIPAAALRAACVFRTAPCRSQSPSACGRAPRGDAGLVPRPRPGQEPHIRDTSSEVYSWSVFLICEALPHGLLHHSADTWTSVQLIIPVTAIVTVSTISSITITTIIIVNVMDITVIQHFQLNTAHLAFIMHPS